MKRMKGEVWRNGESTTSRTSSLTLRMKKRCTGHLPSNPSSASDQVGVRSRVPSSTAYTALSCHAVINPEWFVLT